MACKKEHVPFSGTPEQEAALKKVIAELKDTKGALMPIICSNSYWSWDAASPLWPDRSGLL